jgi:PAS domain S-box-containing protein
MLKAEVIGQLLLMQNILINLPDKKSIFSFVCRGLMDLPGVENVYYSEIITNKNNNSTLCISFENNKNHYGELMLKISDYDKFSDYEQYIRNFVFMIEVILEEKNQRELNEKYQSELENRVEERTRLLSDEIEERKLIEESLKERNTLLRIAGEKAKLGGWSVNLIDNRLFWSDEVASIHELSAGFSPGLEEGINFYCEEWHEKITKVFNDCCQNGVPYDEEMEIITAKGNRKWIRTIGEAVRNGKGEIYKVQGAFQDISERKQRELEIRQQLEELQKWHNITLGRESRIMEIKREVNELCIRLGEPPRYPSQENNQ